MPTQPSSDRHRDQPPTSSPLQNVSPSAVSPPDAPPTRLEQLKTPSIQLLPPTEPSSFSNNQSHKLVSGLEPTSTSLTTRPTNHYSRSPSSSSLYNSPNTSSYPLSGSATVSVSRNSRRSLASIAFEKTSNAFANFTASRASSSTSQSNQSLRSASSSGSLPRNSIAGVSNPPAPTSAPAPTAEEVKTDPVGVIAELPPTDFPPLENTVIAPTPSSAAERVSQEYTRRHKPQSKNHHQTTVSQPLPSTSSTDDTSSNSAAQSNRRHTIQGNPLTVKRAPSPLPESQPPGGPESRMHQTSSRLLRMTSEDRPFTKDFKDLFATLMVSLKLESHRLRFTKFEHTFTSEEAINNLGSLKFSQSNRMPDPKDPSRIVTTTTTTTFSMAKEMARSVCQRFVDARFIEAADGRPISHFPMKGALFQLTPKGICVLQVFCQRNGITARHVLDVLESPRNTMQLVVLERDSSTDKLSHDRGTIEVIFRRFAGQDGPNIKSSVSTSDSDSLSDYTNGMVGVKMAKERKINDKIVQNTFTGKAAVDWLMDCCMTIDRRETFEIAELFVRHGLMWCVMEDKTYSQQDPTATVFQPTKHAVYGVTDRGQRICGWIARDKSLASTYNGKPAPRDSNNARLNNILQDPALRLLFREFLRHSLCEENLSFYIDVSEFTSHYHKADKAGSFSKTDAVRETLAAAYGLYNAFLAPGSPCELNIEHALRNSLASRMTRAVGDDESMLKSLQEVVGLFELAQTSVFKLMSSDSVPKFIREPRYADVLSEHNFDTGGRAFSPSRASIPERSMSRSMRP